MTTFFPHLSTRQDNTVGSSAASISDWPLPRVASVALLLQPFVLPTIRGHACQVCKLFRSTDQNVHCGAPLPISAVMKMSVMCCYDLPIFFLPGECQLACGYCKTIYALKEIRIVIIETIAWVMRDRHVESIAHEPSKIWKLIFLPRLPFSLPTVTLFYNVIVHMVSDRLLANQDELFPAFSP